jgi:hypothetical protein
MNDFSASGPSGLRDVAPGHLPPRDVVGCVRRYPARAQGSERSEGGLFAAIGLAILIGMVTLIWAARGLTRGRRGSWTAMVVVRCPLWPC